MDLEKYKKNQKTQYLASVLETLLKEEGDILELAKDPSMKEMAENERIYLSKKKIWFLK